MQSSTFANALSFSVFQNTGHRQTNFLSRQLHFQSSISYTGIREATWSSYFLEKDFFFRSRSCSEELLLSGNYFLVTNNFSDQLLLEYRCFFSTITVMFRRSYFFRISNYSKHVLFRSRQFFQTATFSEEELF